MERDRGNQEIRATDPCFKRWVPQCNELRKILFEISRSGTFSVRPLSCSFAIVSGFGFVLTEPLLEHVSSG
jgi:hypothetical protein